MPDDLTDLVGRRLDDVLEQLYGGKWDIAYPEGRALRFREKYPVYFLDERATPTMAEPVTSERLAALWHAVLDGRIRLEADLPDADAPAWVTLGFLRAGGWEYDRTAEPPTLRRVDGKGRIYYTPRLVRPVAANTATMRKHDDAKPKRRPGRKSIDDTAKITAAKKLIKKEGVSEWQAAQHVAADTFPKNEDSNKRENLARRIYKKLRD